MKANENKTLSFPFTCFSESGLFNGLQAEKIKKIRSQSQVVRENQIKPSHPPCSSPDAVGGAVARSDEYSDHSIDF